MYWKQAYDTHKLRMSWRQMVELVRSNNDSNLLLKVFCITLNDTSQPINNVVAHIYDRGLMKSKLKVLKHVEVVTMYV